jgi:hypothetical protein
MLSAAEKRFIRYWEDQRKDGKWSYVLTYTIGWGVIIFFLPLTVSYILSMLNFIALYQLPIWVIIVLSLLIGFAGNLFFWHRNEEKWKALTRK